MWGDKETKQKIYELAKKEARKPTKEVKRKLICVTIAELFGYVAENFGFEVFYQKRIPGTSIYGLSENELFTDDYIKDLANSLRRQEKTPIEMVEEFMNDPRITEELKNTRCIEANKIYKLILNACYVKKEQEDSASIDECILFDNKGQKRYSFCIHAEQDGQKVFYVYSKSSRKMVKLTEKELQQMIEKGMHIGLKSQCLQNGNEKTLSVNEQQSSMISSKEGCLASLIKDIFWDESNMELE